MRRIVWIMRRMIWIHAPHDPVFVQHRLDPLPELRIETELRILPTFRGGRSLEEAP